MEKEEVEIIVEDVEEEEEEDIRCPHSIIDDIKLFARNFALPHFLSYSRELRCMNPMTKDLLYGINIKILQLAFESTIPRDWVVVINKLFQGLPGNYKSILNILKRCFYSVLPMRVLINEWGDPATIELVIYNRLEMQVRIFWKASPVPLSST